MDQQTKTTRKRTLFSLFLKLGKYLYTNKKSGDLLDVNELTSNFIETRNELKDFYTQTKIHQIKNILIQLLIQNRVVLKGGSSNERNQKGNEMVYILSYVWESVLNQKKNKSEAKVKLEEMDLQEETPKALVAKPNNDLLQTSQPKDYRGYRTRSHTKMNFKINPQTTQVSQNLAKSSNFESSRSSRTIGILSFLMIRLLKKGNLTRNMIVKKTTFTRQRLAVVISVYKILGLISEDQPSETVTWNGQQENHFVNMKENIYTILEKRKEKKKLLLKFQELTQKIQNKYEQVNHKKNKRTLKNLNENFTNISKICNINKSHIKNDFKEEGVESLTNLNSKKNFSKTNRKKKTKFRIVIKSKKKKIGNSQNNTNETNKPNITSNKQTNATDKELAKVNQGNNLTTKINKNVNLTSNNQQSVPKDNLKIHFKVLNNPLKKTQESQSPYQNLRYLNSKLTFSPGLFKESPQLVAHNLIFSPLVMNSPLFSFDSSNNFSLDQNCNNLFDDFNDSKIIIKTPDFGSVNGQHNDIKINNENFNNENIFVRNSKNTPEWYQPGRLFRDKYSTHFDKKNF
ncbi:hypothetical protein M0813_06730 [Anaeramoeba flamelloides]|uniref:E2F/DP family winged-helix DNA-binding domain-containing protein n=1 Tax=Anaeramoeba flamelloides TaxID=1746091 RepID=A0ABQ8XCX4_9EUKA|nr:hypothetical protein M0813_06730 [Anaeramoeba flamelloides]